MGTARIGRGFTLLETVLAMVIASAVLLSAMGVFGTLAAADRVFAKRYNETTDLAMTQRVMRQAMLTPVIAPNVTSPASNARADGLNPVEEEPTERQRIILQPDPGAMLGGIEPQRFEIVLSSSPTPASLNGAGALWAQEQDVDPDDMNYSSDQTGGMIRGVFELRPDGSRERIMRQLGIDSLSWRRSPRQRQRVGSDDPTREITWTLWWRPMPLFETNQLFAGQEPMSDFDGDDETRALRLAQAVPLARGLTACTWSIFKGRERLSAYVGQSWDDLPAYVEMELETSGGNYANWLFEISWTVADDVSDLGSDLDGNDDADILNGGGGGGGGDNQGFGGGGRDGGGGGRDGDGRRDGGGQSERYPGGRGGRDS